METSQAENSAAEQPVAPLKPWKQRHSRRSSVEVDKPGGIEIFESKVQSSRLLSAIKPAPVDAYMKVRTGDGILFVVPTVVLKESEQVKLMLNMDAAFREKVENVVHFEEIRGEVMEVVLRFCFEDHLNKARVAQLYGVGGPRPRLAFHFEVAPALAMEIISAAHFLGLKELLQLASAMVAHNLPDVPDVSTLPKDLAWVVALHLSAEGLLEAEEREDFQAIALDSPGLWERHCQTRHWTGVASLGLSESSDRGEPALFDAAAPDYWKRVYVTHDLHFTSASVTSDSFPDFHSRVQRWGKFAAFQLIGQSLYEDVRMCFERDALVRYASLFPELRWLVLDRIDFEQSQPGGEAVTNRPKTSPDSPCENSRGEATNLEALLRALPCLQVFVVKAPTAPHVDNSCQAPLVSVRKRGLGSVDVRALSRFLRVHRKLTLLDWSTNPLANDDFWEILRSLPQSCLKILDLRWCEIPSCSSPLDVLAGLQGSVLESLLLSGNPFGKPQWQQLDAVPVEEGSWRKVNGVWRKTMATPSARRPAKASPSSKKSPTAGSGSVKKRGPVKRPEWNLCFLTGVSDAAPMEAISPMDDAPGGSGERGSASQSPGADEPGTSIAQRSISQILGSHDTGFDSQPTTSKGSELPETPLEGGLGGQIQETGTSSMPSRDQERAGSGAIEPSTSSPVRRTPHTPASLQPSVSGFEGMNGRRAVERPGGVILGTVRAERVQSNAPVDAESGTEQPAPSVVCGNAPAGTTDGVTNQIYQKGKGKIDDGPAGNSAAPSGAPNPAKPPSCSDREPEEDPSPSIKGKEHVADAAEHLQETAATSLEEAPTVILGSLLTALPRTLTTLALSDCALGDVHVAQIVRGLTSAGCALEDLDLSQNEVSARGARSVFAWLQENRSLRRLSLAQNKVTSSCIDALVAALRCHVALVKLSLAGNYSFGEERVPDVLEAAREHADLLAALDARSVFSLDLSFIDVTYSARNRLRDVYGAYEHLELQI